MKSHKILSSALGLVLAVSLLGMTAPVSAQELYPYFSVSISYYNRVDFYDWLLGYAVTLTIDDPTNGPGVDYTDVKMPSPSGVEHTEGYFSIRRSVFTLQPGQLVTLTNGIITKTHKIRDLAITSVDAGTDIVYGTAEANTLIRARARCEQAGCIPLGSDILVDGNGNWQADFTGIVDITPGMEGYILQHDEYNGMTQISWRVPNPTVIAYPDEDVVGAQDFAAGTPVTITIDNPNNGAGIDKTIDGVVNSVPGGWECQRGYCLIIDLWEVFDVRPGQVITITDGINIYSYTVSYLSIIFVNMDENTVSGAAEPLSDVYVETGYSGGRRHVYADDAGHWLADFSIVGDESFEQEILDFRTDLTEDDFLIAYQFGEGGETWVDSIRRLNPIFMLNVLNDSSWDGLDAWNWPLGSQVTLTVDNPNTPQMPDYTEVQPMEVGKGSHSTHAMYMQDDEFQGQPGFTITLSDGIQTKTMIVPLLQGTKYDLEADTVNGVTDPFAHVIVACDEGIEPTVIADSEGNWTANFRDPENPEVVIYDVRPGTWCEPQMPDVDWDIIVLRNWSVQPNQPPSANAGSDQIGFIGDTVTLNASTSFDPDGDVFTYAWDLNDDGLYDDATSMTVQVSFSQVGEHVIGLQVTDVGGLSDTDTATVTILPWTLKGFYQPADMNSVYNLVKGGSTVPLKFEIFAGSAELTDIFDVKNLTYAETACDKNVATDEIEVTTIGSTSLRYDIQSGQFIYNWKTPSTAGKCYRVTMMMMDGSSLVAYFKIK